MVRKAPKRGQKEAIVDEWKIVVGQKYECRFNNDSEEKLVSCITKEKKADGTWLVQYSGLSTQVIVDESNISAKNGNVIVPCESPEKRARQAKRDKNKADAVKAVVFKDILVVVAIENTTVVAPTQEKSTSQVIAAAESANPLDVMKEIKLQGKFKLSNNRRFRELAGNASGCSCDCALCVAPVTNYLTPFMDTMLCKRENDSAHYRLGCVLGKCPKCGWDKVLTVRVEPLG